LDAAQNECSANSMKLIIDNRDGLDNRTIARIWTCNTRQT